VPAKRINLPVVFLEGEIGVISDAEEISGRRGVHELDVPMRPLDTIMIPAVRHTVTIRGAVTQGRLSCTARISVCSKLSKTDWESSLP
jgi:hypothetical protein